MQNKRGTAVTQREFNALLGPLAGALGLSLDGEDNFFVPALCHLLGNASGQLHVHPNRAMGERLHAEAISRLEELGDDADFEIGRVCRVMRFLLPMLWIVMHSREAQLDDGDIQTMMAELSIPATGKVYQIIIQ